MRLRSSIVAVALVVALAARLPGIGWGLPHVYEEATPLHRAWAMSGWGEEHLDLNPHFFHYPTLTFYAHLGAQALLHAGMRVSGISTEAFRIQYYTDPRPQVITARVLSTLFALITILALAWLPRVTGAAWAGGAAALLLALNVFHIVRSRMIEVDVPLTTFVTVALVLIGRVARAPARKSWIAAGVVVGLAASAKYTGAVLLVPLLAAAVMVRRSNPERASWRWVAESVAAAAGAFVLTSPYVLLDFSAFLRDFSLEREHMELGHFGAGGEAAALFYLRRLGGALAGWPVLAFAAVGVVVEAVVRRRQWAVVTTVFVAAYAATIASWSMAADRYALPLLPPLLALAAGGVAVVVQGAARTRRARVLLAVLAVGAMAAPHIAGRHALRAQTATDSRTTALTWLERNVEPGSLVVTEAYGPPLFGPLEFWRVPADIRSEVYRLRSGSGFRGVMPIPLFQSQPEETAPYYDLRLYTAADIIITTGAVRGRYSADPPRFPVQNAFYDALDGRRAGPAEFDLVYTVDAAGTGPRLFIYRSLDHARPFASRAAGTPPRIDGDSLPPRWRAWFYYRQGLNYEAFGHLKAALESYQRGWPDTARDPETFRQISYGVVRVLRLLGRSDEIEDAVRHMKAAAPGRSEREFLDRILGTLSP